MKKILYFIMMAVFIISLSACKNDKLNGSNIASEADLTKREKAILSTVSDKSFVFDFKTDGTFKEVSVWVEKYEFGKLVNDNLCHITTKVNDNGSIIFGVSKTIENKSLFNINVDGSTISVEETIFDNGYDSGGSIWGSNTQKNIPITDNMVFASISYSKGNNGMSTLTSDFYDDVDGHLYEIKNYDVVYLLRGKFTK